MDNFPKLNASPITFEDERGSLEVLYESSTTVLKRSFSKTGVFRGLHVQKAPFYQTKLIRVISGSIIDFLVDIEGDQTEIFSQIVTPDTGWVKIERNFAHGFYAREDTSFEYICDGKYNEAAELSYSIIDYLKDGMGLDDLIVSKKDLDALPLSIKIQP